MDDHVRYANFSEAAREGNIAVLSKCSRKDVNKSDIDGMTPVHWASMYGHLHALRLLIGKGGNPDKTCRLGCTAVHFAAGGGHFNCLVFLTNYGCNVYSINDSGATPIQEAARNEQFHCMRHIEALITHQVSQNKTKVEKMQVAARKEAEKRIREKKKLLEKIDKGVAKKVRQRERIMHGKELPTVSQELSFPQVTRTYPSYNNKGLEGNAVSDEDINGNSKDCENEVRTENSFDTSLDHDDNKAGPSEESSLPSLDFSKLDKNINSSPSKISKLPIKSFHSNPSGTSLNTNNFRGMSASYDELMAYKASKSSSHHSPLRTQSSTNLPSLTKQANVSNGKLGNALPSRKQIARKTGDIDPAMGTLYTLLHSLQLDEFRELFRQEKIDLHASLLCNEDDLREIGLPVGPRKKFLDAICKRNRVLRSDNELVDTDV